MSYAPAVHQGDTGEVSEILLHFAPGGPREGHVEGLSHVADLSADEPIAFSAEHDNYWL